MTEDVAQGPGLLALDQAIDLAYPDSETGWVAPLRPEEHDLSGVSVTTVDGPAPHFLLVTYGLSDLGAKESDDPAVSGAGFELTLRVDRDPAGLQPWCVLVLEKLAAHVAKNAGFRAGETFDLGGPVTEGSPLEAVRFTPDVVLPASIATPNGSVAFLRCVLLTRDELDAARLDVG